CRERGCAGGAKNVRYRWTLQRSPRGDFWKARTSCLTPCHQPERGAGGGHHGTAGSVGRGAPSSGEADEERRAPLPDADAALFVGPAPVRRAEETVDPRSRALPRSRDEIPQVRKA